jgi:hypothetical protein
MKKLHFCYLLLFSLLGCSLQADQETNRPIITVWVHGTTLPLTRLVARSFLVIPRGFYLASSLPSSHHHYKIASWLHESDPEQFPLETFYFFGWSGKLSASARLEAAKTLSEHLRKLIQEYKKKYGQDPFIQIITHSHGGNVVLNLSQCGNELSLDRVILLACPIQEETASYICCSLFKEAFLFYSLDDLLQVMDPQGVWSRKQGNQTKKKFFSSRTFDENPKLIQVRVCSSGRRGFWHIDFLLEKFVKRLPGLLKSVKSGAAPSTCVTL